MVTKLTRVFRKSVETKYGLKPKLSIQTEEHGEDWLSTFKIKGTEDWKDGDTVDISVEKKGDFLNFEPNGVGGGKTNDHEARIQKLEGAVFGTKDAGAVIDVTEDEGDGF